MTMPIIETISGSIAFVFIYVYMKNENNKIEENIPIPVDLLEPAITINPVIKLNMAMKNSNMVFM